MPVVHHSNVTAEPFKGGATYQTLIGDEQGSMPIRVGIQTSPPGYKTAVHSHPDHRAGRRGRGLDPGKRRTRPIKAWRDAGLDP